MHNTIYPHPYQVQKISIFPNDPSRPNGPSKTVAGVLLRYGPVSLRARLVQGDNGLFLSMPARKSEATGQYYDHVWITDRTLMETLEALAVSEYHRELNNPQRVEVAA